MIEVRELSKNYNGMPVLNGIDLDINDNETLVILGPSGQGKTVFIKSLVRLIEPDSGTIRYDGIDVLTLPKRKFIAIQKKIAFVFQDNALFDFLNVKENLSLYLRMHSKLSEKEIFKEVLRAIEFVRMNEEVLDKYPEELSGGMMKRIAIARAIIQQPCYMFYDEPTTGLDEANVEMVVELIHKFKKRVCKFEKRVCATVVIVTHDIHLMHAVSDRVVLLKEGKIVFVGKKEEISEESLHRLYDTGVRDDL
ncbi:MAG: ATP-binding cassette domain-containing protein [Candidatus Aminicenantes bacterium]|nr:ATP-binding cassette domain-containing protein [Candidatus Aminicenantes bacterium]